LEASDLVVTDRLFLRTAGYLRFGGNWHHIIFRRIVFGLIFFRIVIQINMESEYDSNLQIGMALSIK
jgi:hypothetical protein